MRMLSTTTLKTAAFTALRIWLALQWLNSGLHKITDPKWTDGSGRGLATFWTSALAPTAHGGSAITYDWYRGFLQFLVDAHAETWFSKLIASGETAVGLGLLVGALVPMAALGGLTMNMSYMLAGAASVNPVLALAAGVLIVSQGHANVIGLDGLLRRISGRHTQPTVRAPRLIGLRPREVEGRPVTEAA
jgi:thiosulfate dehydrogenase [quinone] large subunit